MTLRPGSLQRVREAALRNPRQSELHRWLRRHRLEFEAIVKEAGRPNWSAIAEAIAAEGLKDAAGKAPSGETVRQTWWKVRKAREDVRAGCL